jgi:hypothetical protein
VIDTTIPHASRCSFCHSYQPLRRVELNPVDDYVQSFRFFCDANCQAKFETHQVHPSRDVRRIEAPIVADEMFAP